MTPGVINDAGHGGNIRQDFGRQKIHDDKIRQAIFQYSSDGAAALLTDLYLFIYAILTFLHSNGVLAYGETLVPGVEGEAQSLVPIG